MLINTLANLEQKTNDAIYQLNEQIDNADYKEASRTGESALEKFFERYIKINTTCSIIKNNIDKL